MDKEAETQKKRMRWTTFVSYWVAGTVLRIYNRALIPTTILLCIIMIFTILILQRQETDA